MGRQPAKSIVADSMWLRIDSPAAGYASSVVTVVARISRTRSGRAILEHLRASGGSFKIERPDPPTDPRNAWIRRREAIDGGGTEIVIAYDPADWPNPAQLDQRPSDEVLFGLFEDALMMATGAEVPNEPRAGASPALEAYVGDRTAPP
jgi:hypothetical protein